MPIKTPEKLKEGARRFLRDVYPQKAHIYQTAARGPQQPHSLIIGCSDSRVPLEVFTSSEPGEVFVTRNVGNMVPVHGHATAGSTAAVIEYAVAALKVRHIIICGHLDCGAMKALLAPESTVDLPNVRAWLPNAQDALTAAGAADIHEGPTQHLRRLIEANVLLQLEHLKTHPSVEQAMSRGELSSSGWVYNIATGEVEVTDLEGKKFEPLVTDVQ